MGPGDSDEREQAATRSKLEMLVEKGVYLTRLAVSSESGFRVASPPSPRPGLPVTAVHWQPSLSLSLSDPGPGARSGAARDTLNL